MLKKQKRMHYLPFIISVTFLCASFFYGFIRPEIFLNSDAIYPYSIIKSVLSDGVPILSWYPSPSPYVFPDLIAYFITYIIAFGSLKASVVIFALLQHALYFASLAALLKAINVKKPVLISSFTVLISSVLSTNTTIYAYSLIPVFHFGSYLASLFSLLLFKKYIDRGMKKHLLLLIILTAAISYSDNIFLIWFSLPLLVVGGLSYFKCKDVKYITTPLYLLFSSVCGKLASSYLFFNSQVYTYKPNLYMLSEGARKAFLDIMMTRHGCLSVTIITIGFIFAAYDYRKRKEISWLSVYLSMTWLSFIGMFVLLSAQTEMPPGERYYMPMFFGAISIVLIFAFSCGHTKVISAFIVLIASIGAAYSIRHIDNLYGLISPDEICVGNSINELPHKSGVSSYWGAKKLSAILGVNIAQVNQHLVPSRWITSESFFTNKYYFAIQKFDDPSSINFNSLQLLNGYPDKLINCGVYKVNIYNNGLRINGGVNFSKVGSSEVYAARMLAPANHSTYQGGEIIPASSFTSGNLSYGPYVKLPSGEYKVKYTFYNNSSSNVSVKVDSSTDAGRTTLYSSGYSGADHVIEISGVFDMPLSHDNSPVELRTFLDSRFNVSLKSIEIERIK